MNKNIIVYSLILILIILIIYLFLGFRQLSSTVSDNDPQSPTSSIPPTVDLSNYYTKSEADSSFPTKSDVDTNIQNSIRTIRTDQGGNVYSVAGNKEIGYEVDIDGKFNFNSPVDFKEHAGFYGTATLTNKVAFTDNVDFHYNDTNFLNNVNFHKNVNILPRGSIIAWNYDPYSSPLPKGWAKCDGGRYSLNSNGDVYDDPNNGVQTPDLRGRFVLGWGTTDGNSIVNTWGGNGGSACYDEQGLPRPKGCAYDRTGDQYNVGLRSGTNKVTLTTQQMPRHTHKLKLDIFRAGHYGSNTEYEQDTGHNDIGEHHGNPTKKRQKETLWEAGNNESHNNMPPYYVLVYIMRL